MYIRCGCLLYVAVNHLVMATSHYSTSRTSFCYMFALTTVVFTFTNCRSCLCFMSVDSSVAQSAPLHRRISGKTPAPPASCSPDTNCPTPWRPVATPSRSSMPSCSANAAECHSDSDMDGVEPEELAAASTSSRGGPVSSLRDLMRFACANLDATDDPHESAVQLADALDHCDSLSSSFSGVCAETVALNMTIAQLEARLGRPVNRPRYLFAIDKDVECQRESKLVPNGPICQFKSLEDFSSPALAEELTSESLPYDADRLVALCNRPGALRLDAPCTRHPCRGRCRAHRATGQVGGLPCTDFTSWGKAADLEGQQQLPPLSG